MRLALLLLLALPLTAQQMVLVVECGAYCDKLKAFLNRVAENPTAAKVLSDRGLIFGDPVCEPAGVANRRCAWSHSFSEGTGVGDPDILWAAKRIVAQSANIGLPGITLAELAKLTEQRPDGTLPANWRFPAIP